MKTTLLFIFLTVLVSCTREEASKDIPLEAADAAAVTAMQQQENALRQTSLQLAMATTTE